MIFNPFGSYSQIQGTIHDRNNQPLSFANILLINQKDSSVVTGIMSSDVGTFSNMNFNTGKYLIKTSMIGYKSIISESFEIKSTGMLNFEPLVLRFTYAHNFGSKKVKAGRNRETGSDEEKKRVD